MSRGLLDSAGLVKQIAAVEREGAVFYKSLTQNTSNEELRNLAKALGHAEHRHQARFEDLSHALRKRKQPLALSGDKQDYVLALIHHRIFGEMALFEKSHERSATAIAMESSQLLVLLGPSII